MAAPVPANALLDVAAMAESDRRAVALGVPGVELMRAAGEAVTREIERRWPARRVTVLCGPGNNGGDGFVVAGALAGRGWPVRVALLGEMASLRGDAAHFAARWQGAVQDMVPAAVEDAELVVDAVFGAGLNRPLPPNVCAVLERVARLGLPVVAVDVPSGVAGDTGESFGAIPAQCTVTFTRKKPGHLLLPGRALCGEVVLADIGTPAAALEDLAVLAFENDPSSWRGELPSPRVDAHKFSRGHALLYGGERLTGAARLAARAAARAGAGITTIVTPAAAWPVYAAALVSVLVKPLSSADDLRAALAEPRLTALLIGPGAGVGASTRRATLDMLATGKPVVLDADALTSFEGEVDALAAAVRGPCVLTPHEGEFARLFPATGDKLTRARAAARRLRAVVALKGADTVVAAPDGRAVVNANAPPTLATAGSGDVLGGFVLGLLAQGMDAFAAAAAAVWLHGACAAEFGPGLIAEDLPELLPAVLRRLGV